MTTPPTRWELEYTGDNWEAYRARFEKLFEIGTDVEGEARFVDALCERGAAVLDAGCGTGRIAAALHRLGHRVAGVDKDAGLIEVAQGRYPGVNYLAADLLALTAADLAEVGAPEAFDVVVLPGNVLVFVAPGTERAVLANLAGLLVPGGRLVAGFATDRDYSPADLRADAQALGLPLEHSFATWQLDPMTDDAGWTVVVLRRPQDWVAPA
ncbi:methyltransferase domain-containing protein [Nakamurella sp. YIM 132087]|uniref:Methyltransferase domain-containing protein n=1 Tax=Nakamurella alba TaxID=2665158 RepID=A0A7K1FJ24_9ACTN|nr:methyltransferase domain-containing protein [Nakamurella alba]MTD12884.1 methyltransferase domain-containing protein [Nakamurella alba]